MSKETDNVRNLLLAIQEADTVLLRNFLPDDDTKTYRLDPQEQLDEDSESVSFTDVEYGDAMVTRAELSRATIAGHEAKLPVKHGLIGRSILCFDWKPHNINA